MIFQILSFIGLSLPFFLYSHSSATDRHWADFSDFQFKFDKRYENLEELKHRFEIFKENAIEIYNHNKNENKTFTLSINQFTDLSREEFVRYYVSGLNNYQSYGCATYTAQTNVILPSSVDWRQNGAVSSVKDQGQCGSCWTFSSTGAVEGAWAISKGKLLDLAEQELVDCAQGFKYGSHGCNGGQMEGAFKYVIENGQCVESSYPYTAKDGTCQKCQSSVSMSKCYDVNPNDQLSLKSAVSKQPVSVAIEADTFYFQSYSNGVLTSDKCGTKLDHGVLAVGYGTENGNDYWLVKNSWGTSWGDKGYVKIGRSDSTNNAGICGIAMQPSYPVV
jgi:C1A family cysteine protease